MSLYNSHESITEHAFSLTEKKKSHPTSSQKSKAKKKERIGEQRRATDSAELANDMRKFLMELKNRRKHPSLINTIRKFFA